MSRKEKGRNRNGATQDQKTLRDFIRPCDWLHHFCGRFWNHDASLEIDRLTIEVERLNELLRERNANELG